MIDAGGKIEIGSSCMFGSSTNMTEQFKKVKAKWDNCVGSRKILYLYSTFHADDTPEVFCPFVPVMGLRNDSHPATLKLRVRPIHSSLFLFHPNESRSTRVHG